MPLYRAELLAKKPLRYAALIHDVSQVLYLPFDYDDGSKARDRSGYGNDGTIYGATKTAGKIGSARDFDGVDDRIEAPHSASLDITKAITVEVWIKSLDARDAGIISKDDGGTARSWWLITWADDLPRFLAYFVTLDGTDGVVATTKLTDNKWHHIAATYDGSTIKIYFDGNLEGTKSRVDTIKSTTAPVRVATYLGVSYFRKGMIDEVRIYRRALSAAEIRMSMYRRLV